MDYLIGIVLGLLLAAGLVLGARRLLRRAVVGAFTGLFDSKSRVLRDASLTVHGIKPAPAPKPGPEFDAKEMAQWLSPEDLEVERARYEAAAAADQRRVWLDLDVTITPKPSTGPFQLWEPDELGFCLPNVSPRAALDEDDHGPDGPEPATIRSVKVWHDGKFGREYCDKLPGDQRVQLRLGVLPEHRQLQLFYYFESLGVVTFPEASEARS
jgi:hypothetical protein